MVIFAPWTSSDALGASPTLRTFFICSLVHPRNGPPDAANRIFQSYSRVSLFKHWKIALCFTVHRKKTDLFSFTSGMMRCPAVTSVSLVCQGNVLSTARWQPSSGGCRSCPPLPSRGSPHPFHDRDLQSPSMPETIFVSVSATRTASSFAFSSIPDTTDLRENSRIWLSSASMFLPAAIPTTSISPFCTGLHPKSGFHGTCGTQNSNSFHLFVLSYRMPINVIAK